MAPSRFPARPRPRRRPSRPRPRRRGAALALGAASALAAPRAGRGRRRRRAAGARGARRPRRRRPARADAARHGGRAGRAGDPRVEGRDVRVRHAARVRRRFEVDRELLGTKRLKVALKYAPIATPHYELYPRLVLRREQRRVVGRRVPPARGHRLLRRGRRRAVEDVGTTTGKDVSRSRTATSRARRRAGRRSTAGRSRTWRRAAAGVMFMDLEFVTKEFRGLVRSTRRLRRVVPQPQELGAGLRPVPNYEVVIQSVEEARRAAGRSSRRSRRTATRTSSQTQCHGDAHANYTQLVSEGARAATAATC